MARFVAGMDGWSFYDNSKMIFIQIIFIQIYGWRFCRIGMLYRKMTKFQKCFRKRYVPSLDTKLILKKTRMH